MHKEYCAISAIPSSGEKFSRWESCMRARYRPNKRIELARIARPARKSKALLVKLV